MNFWYEGDIYFFFTNIFPWPNFIVLSLFKNFLNFFTRRVMFTYTSELSSCWYTFNSPFKEIFICFFSNSSCCSNRLSSNSCSYSFSYSVINVIFDKIFFSKMVVTFGFHALVRDIRAFKFKLLLKKYFPRTVKWFVKWTSHYYGNHLS